MPRGYGWLTNPKKAMYNRIYNRTSISADELARRSGCCLILITLTVFLIGIL